MRLPLSVDELTPEWLGSALSILWPGTVVDSLKIDSVIWGTATKAFVEVTYAEKSEMSGLPERLCVKGGFRPELLQVMALGYQTEAQFYRDIGSSMSDGLPTCYFAGVDAATGQGIVVLEDLSTQGVSFGDPQRPLTPDQVAEGLIAQASWHSAPPPDLAWLTGPDSLRAVIKPLMEPAFWSERMSTDVPQIVQAALPDRARYLRGMERIWEIEDAAPPCVTHGDANISNLYVDRDGRPKFIDWQFVALSDWSHDVGMFLIGSLSVEERRTHERELLREYLAARAAAAGGHTPSWDDAWSSYRIHTLHGLIAWLTPDEMQKIESRGPQAIRYAHAAVDHDSYRLLGI